VRIGGLSQNIESAGHAHEDGLAVNGEVLFAAPFGLRGDDLVDRLLAFRPHLGASYSLARDTDKLYAGLTWDLPLERGFFLEASMGLAIHDGGLDDPAHAQYGCRVNMRESVGLGYDLDRHWRLMLMLDHMSNGNLCAQNRGLTQGGLRLGYRLD
jgi:hypothetical protein